MPRSWHVPCWSTWRSLPVLNLGSVGQIWRPKLKRLLPLARCDPRELFALPSALALDSVSWEPACADGLEELSIELYPSWEGGDRHLPVNEWPKDQRETIWRLVFRRLSVFRNLKSLSIQSVDIDHQAAMQEIASAGGWMNLEKLTMMDPRATAWDEYELVQ